MWKYRNKKRGLIGFMTLLFGDEMVDIDGWYSWMRRTGFIFKTPYMETGKLVAK